MPYTKRFNILSNILDKGKRSNISFSKEGNELGKVIEDESNNGEDEDSQLMERVIDKFNSADRMNRFSNDANLKGR